MHFKKVVIIGVGLIGGSIGKALISKGLADEVVGICRRDPSLEKALKEKAVTKGSVEGYERALEGADLVLVATPVKTIKDVLSKMADILSSKDVLVTDVGSTKKEIVEFADGLADSFSFVGSHPLAGSEKAGVEFSTIDLLDGSVCVVTPGQSTDKENVAKICDLWEALGAKVVMMTPDEHDKNLAFSSHLPHAVAYALVGALEEGFPKDMLATGFKDTTRIASSDPELWGDIFMSNRDNILKAVEKYKEALSGIESDIKSGDIEELKKRLGSIKKERDDAFRQG